MHSQCQNGQMQISCDTTEFTDLLLWTLEKRLKIIGSASRNPDRHRKIYDANPPNPVPLPELTPSALSVFPLLFEFSGMTPGSVPGNASAWRIQNNQRRRQCGHPQAGLDLQDAGHGLRAWLRALVPIAISGPENEIDCGGSQSLELGIAFMLTDSSQPTV